MFEIDKELNIFSKKNIPGKYLFKNSHKEWMEILVGIFQELTESYKKFVSNDGRLVGAEKNTLKVKLETLLYLVVSLVQSLEGEKPLLLEENRGQDLQLVFFSASLYEIKGAISNKKLLERKDMRHWLSETITSILKNLISRIGKSLQDGEINSGEKNEILKEALTVLCELVYINIAIEYTEMNQ